MYIAAFPRKSEFDKMLARLDASGLSYTIITPEPGFGLVGCPAIAMSQEVRSRVASCSPDEVYSSGWVEYRQAAIEVPDASPRCFQEDVFGTASIQVLSPCIADETKLRLVAHISGDMTEVFPYLNAEMRGACYNENGPMLTFMDGHRLITIYPHRIAMGKADDIVDAWRTLEKIRCLANDTYSRRASVTPLYTMRKKPATLDIYKRLPGTNCRECGQKTCMAFALTLWSGSAKPIMCKPIFGGGYAHLRDAFLEICVGLGATTGENLSETA
ncbi:MAG TPA: (Fe-S)-binding protein [Syntrophorhabdus sp.]|nr:(Fe-S)-binding protein [Syntrophorhabdus sp.]